MTAPSPDSDIRTALAGSGLGLVAGTNLFCGPVRAPMPGVPPLAVFVLASGGYGPRPLLGSHTDYRISTVQVTVRSAEQDFAGGQSLARSVLIALQRAAITGYASVVMRESEPNYLGQDQDARHLWSLNAEMGHEQ